MGEVSLLLQAIERGDAASDQLLPLVYDELRRLAAARLEREPGGQTLQPTALVHEAYLRLVGDEQRWDNKGHFFAAAAEAMSRILVESSRRKQCLRHDGGMAREVLEPGEVAAPEQDEYLLALHDALTALAEARPAVARLVELRYFAGLTIKEAAQVLGVSPRTADTYWAYARAWMLDWLGVNQGA